MERALQARAPWCARKVRAVVPSCRFRQVLPMERRGGQQVPGVSHPSPRRRDARAWRAHTQTSIACGSRARRRAKRASARATSASKRGDHSLLAHRLLCARARPREENLERQRCAAHAGRGSRAVEEGEGRRPKAWKRRRGRKAEDQADGGAEEGDERQPKKHGGRRGAHK